MKNVVFLLSCVFVITGCSSVANVQTDDSPQVIGKTDAKNIKVYSTEKIGQEYFILGQVVADSDAGENAAVAVDKMRSEAAKLGADAVINLRLEIDTGYLQNAIKAYGTAVKIK